MRFTTGIIANDSGLYNDGKKLQLIFGDKDQIKAIRKYEQKAEELNGDGHVLDLTYNAQVNFECLCGRHLYLDVTLNDSLSLHPFQEEVLSCESCKREYEFEESEEGELLIKNRYK